MARLNYRFVRAVSTFWDVLTIWSNVQLQQSSCKQEGKENEFKMTEAMVH